MDKATMDFYGIQKYKGGYKVSVLDHFDRRPAWLCEWNPLQNKYVTSVFNSPEEAKEAQQKYYDDWRD